MPARFSLPLLPLLLALQGVPVPLQTPAPPQPLELYLRGEVDAAIAIAGRLPLTSEAFASRPEGPNLHGVAWAMLLTETAMHLGTFGRYALSAPLTPAPVSVGLTGRFEIRSYAAYRSIEEAVARAPADSAADTLALARGWYGLTISYCLRWKLDCADALAAAAERDFPTDGDVLLVVGSTAEARRQWTTAAAHYRGALDRAPAPVEARLRLGVVERRRGRTAVAARELTAALDAARGVRDRFSEHFALLALADLDAAAGRTTRARERRVQAAALNLFADQPELRALDPWAVYGAGQFHQHDARLAALRDRLREWAARNGGGG